VTKVLDSLQQAQTSDLALPRASFSRALATIDAFSIFGRTLAPTPTNAYWWLKGWALLAYPFMPQVCGEIWALLGYTGEPRLADYPERRAFARPDSPPEWFAPISRSQVESCVHRS
jgi:methionyl-tRNA synthetase